MTVAAPVDFGPGKTTLYDCTSDYITLHEVKKIVLACARIGNGTQASRS
jgi:hypothetical protein